MSRRLPWVKWYPKDALADTRTLTLEQRGFYREVLDLMWLRQSGLPNDPAEIAKEMSVSVRVVRRLLEVMFTRELLYVDGGLILNKRMNNGFNERKFDDSLDEVSPMIDDSLPDVSPKISPNSDNKSSKNNGLSNAPLEERIKKRDSDRKKPPKPPLAGGPADSSIFGFEGSRSARRKAAYLDRVLAATAAAADRARAKREASEVISHGEC